MSGRIPDRRAFTLIELLVVIMMITLLATVIVPNYARFNKQAEFRSQARKILDLFAYAREQAVSRDTTVIVTYNPQKASFDAYVTPQPVLTDQPAAFVKKDSMDAEVSTSNSAPRTVELDPQFAAGFLSGADDTGSGTGQNGVTTFHFRSDGTVEGGSVMLEDKGNGYAALLRLWPATGRMTMEEDPQR